MAPNIVKGLPLLLILLSTMSSFAGQPDGEPVLVFGGTWGFWGVFFAIPLATLVQAVLKAWARHRKKQTSDSVSQKALDGETA